MPLPYEYDVSTVDLDDFPKQFGDSRLYPVHDLIRVPGKFLVQLQKVALDGRNFAALNGMGAGASGGGIGVLPGLPSIPLPANIVSKTLLADANDLAILTPKTTVIRAVPSGAGRLVTGMRGGVHGRRVTWFNAGSLFLTFKAENSGSSALNRFSMVTDLSLWTGDSATFEYDGISGRWRVISQCVCPVKFSVTRNATQSIATGAEQKVNWDNKEFDTHTWFDIATNRRFQPLLPGRYRFSAMCLIDNLADGNFALIYLYKNGSAFKRANYGHVGAAAMAGTSAGTWTVDMNGSSDYVEIYAQHSNAGSKDLLGSSQLQNFSGELCT